MAKHLLWAVAVLLAVGGVTRRACWCAEPLAQPIPVRIKLQAHKSYLVGLPLRVTAEITNISQQTVETHLPSSDLETISATLQQEGVKDLLVPTIHRHSYAPKGIIQLKPGSTVRAQLDLSMKFEESLPAGRYVCVAYYLYGRSLSTSQWLKSDPVALIIEEPPLGDTQRDLRRHKTLYLAGLVLQGDHNEPSQAAALRVFGYILIDNRDTEYGRAAAFYKARLERDPKSALAAWLAYMEAPAKDAPEMMEPRDIWLIVGRLYYETGDFKAARETLLKIPQPNATVQDYLQRIEKASAPK